MRVKNLLRMEKLQWAFLLAFVFLGVTTATDVTVEFYCGDHKKSCDLLIGTLRRLLFLHVTSLMSRVFFANNITSRREIV